MRAAPAKVCCIRLLLWLLPPAGIKSCAASKQAAAAAACRSEFACIAAASSVCLQDAQLGSVCSCAHQCKQSDLCTARQCAAVRLWHLQQPTQLEMPLLLLADCCCPAAFLICLYSSSGFPPPLLSLCRAGARPAMNAGGQQGGAQKRSLDGSAGGNMAEQQKRARLQEGPVVPPEQESLPQEGSSMDLDALKRRFEALQQEVRLWFVCGRGGGGRVLWLQENELCCASRKPVCAARVLAYRSVAIVMAVILLLCRLPSFLQANCFASRLRCE